ncbi:MAG: hypothetical protein PUE63_11010 [Lachnospiraceae bacterium]|nr:hypothetical protein [Lachnospiraceae bacterium]
MERKISGIFVPAAIMARAASTKKRRLMRRVFFLLQTSERMPEGISSARLVTWKMVFSMAMPIMETPSAARSAAIP